MENTFPDNQVTKINICNHTRDNLALQNLAAVFQRVKSFLRVTVK